jgi:hypothetical protein
MRCIIAQAGMEQIAQIRNRASTSDTLRKVGLETWTRTPALLAQCLQSAAFNAMGV